MIEASSLQTQGEKNPNIFTLDRVPLVHQINVPFTKAEKAGVASTTAATPLLFHYAVCLFAHSFDGQLRPIMMFSHDVRNKASLWMKVHFNNL